MPQLPKPALRTLLTGKMSAADEFELLKRGLDLQENGLLNEAKVIFKAVLENNPRNFDALHLFAINAAQAKNYPLALKLFNKALKLNPGNFYALMNRANVLLESRQFDAALQNYNKVILMQPTHADAYYNRGNAYLSKNRLNDAIANYDVVVSLDAEHAMAYANRGTALKSLKQLKPAFESYKSAQKIKPDLHFLSGMIIFLQMQMCDWFGLSGETMRLVESVNNGEKSSSCLELLASVDDPQLHLRAAIIYGRERSFKGPPLDVGRAKKNNHKILIGYYSADFKDHPVAYLSAGLLENHDKEKFELIAFSLVSTENCEIKRRLMKAFDRFIDVSDKTDKEVAELSRAIGVDIAVDLGGHTTDNRLAIFSYRAAPIQVNFLGYPGTVGVDYIDYIIADKNVIPVEQVTDYVEKVCYLPHSYLPYDPKQVHPVREVTRSSAGLPESAFVFAAFNASHKLTPDLFAVWMRILSDVPDAVLWLAEMNACARENLVKQAEKFAIDPGRLIFANRLERIEDHLARQKLANLALDTFPYNGHTTTIDFLWSGVPVLTRRGLSFASRVAAGLLTTLGLPELIASSNEEYALKAIHFASDRAVSEALKSRLAHKTTDSALFDSALFASNIERAFIRMHERHRDGLPPQSFCVSGA